jgi:glycosyltransferase involved in cell wall biosynthesis
MGEIKVTGKILLFQRLQPHYRRKIFQALYKELGIILCTGRKGPKGTYLSKEKPSPVTEEIRDFYPLPSKETLVFMDIFSPLIKYRPRIVITEFSILILSNYFLLFLKRFFGYKLIIWSPIINTKKGFSPEASLADKLRVWWINQGDAVLTYSRAGKKRLEPYVRTPEKIFVAQNTLYTPELLSLRDRLRKEGKSHVRKELGFSGQYHLIFIGRLIREKRPQALIGIFQKVIRRIPDCHLHIIGDGPERNSLEKKVKDSGLADQVTLYGSINDLKITGKMLFASELAVVPRNLGLAAVHSFCFDTPLITLKSGRENPLHNEEIEYVLEGRTGLTAEAEESMAGMIAAFLRDEKRQDSMKKEMEHMVSRVCSFDKMLKGFKDAIDYVQREKK